jgi:mannose-6-phosphate isomerase class I
MIPMEVSLAAVLGGQEVEVPFFTFVQQQGEKLLGKAAFDAFGGYFPIRFNYDDTFHSGGNMSVQCHPDRACLVEEHGELGGQDESYYVCVAGEGARTYLGFADEESGDAFVEAAQRAQQTGEKLDYRRYLHAVPSRPGTQLLIPAGTVHASGHNQVVLEIGSLTVGSYTYKMYDYQRIDPQTGEPRPIHLEAGKRALHKERTTDWVEENLVNHGGILRETEEGCERAAGDHDLLYFSLRTLRFEAAMSDDTRGAFHVLALTEGERVRVASQTDPARCFVAEYLDVVVVPADFGPYTLINEGEGAVAVHKTLIKDGAFRG